MLPFNKVSKALMIFWEVKVRAVTQSAFHIKLLTLSIVDFSILQASGSLVSPVQNWIRKALSIFRSLSRIFLKLISFLLGWLHCMIRRNQVSQASLGSACWDFSLHLISGSVLFQMPFCACEKLESKSSWLLVSR